MLCLVENRLVVFYFDDVVEHLFALSVRLSHLDDHLGILAADVLLAEWQLLAHLLSHLVAQLEQLVQTLLGHLHGPLHEVLARLSYLLEQIAFRYLLVHIVSFLCCCCVRRAHVIDAEDGNQSKGDNQ